MRHVTLALLVAATLNFALAVAAFAQAPYAPDGQVVVPLGSWTSDLLNFSASIFVAAAGWGMRHVPGEFAWVLRLARVDQLLEKAVNFGLASVEGAVKDKELRVEVANKVLERALDYAVHHAPKLVAKVGGVLELREKIIARLNVEENTYVDRIAGKAYFDSRANMDPGAITARAI